MFALEQLPWQPVDYASRQVALDSFQCAPSPDPNYKEKIMYEMIGAAL